jgi:sugar phosphate isomerase/epimerase
LKDWFPWLLPHLACCHIKDAKTDGTVMPAGQGEGDIRATIEYLIGEGWNGTLTLEPHLKTGGPYGGTSGPELFEVAVQALKKVVGEAGGSC